METPALPHPALSSQPQIGGVVRAVTSESLSVAGVAFINNSAPSGSVLSKWSKCCQIDSARVSA